MKFKQLIDIIRKTHFSLQQRAVSAVDRNLTVRNWLIGFYIAEFEQKGEDRAKYGEKLLEKIAEETKNIKGFSHRNLKLFRQFYSTYPSPLTGIDPHLLMRIDPPELCSGFDPSLIF